MNNATRAHVPPPAVDSAASEQSAVGSSASGSGAHEHLTRYRGFDGLRALAVLVVFVHHLDPEQLPGGFLGVTLFFSLSGFLITHLLLSEHARYGAINLRRFYARRLLRLMPALVAMVAVTLAASVFVGNGETLSDAWPALLYLSDIVFPYRDSWGGIYGHTWSLSVEEQFYLIWPALLVVSLARAWRLPVMVVWATGACVAATVLTTLDPVEQTLVNVYRLPYTHLPIMFCGILLAIAVHRGLGERTRRVLSHRLVGVAVLVIFAVSCWLVSELSIALYRGGWLAAGAIMTCLVGNLVVQPHGRLAELLSLRPVVWLGQRSYGFYLWHYPVILLIKPLLEGSPYVLVGGCCLALTLVLTETSWRVVEQPFLKLKHRFETPLPALAPDGSPNLRT